MMRALVSGLMVLSFLAVGCGGGDDPKKTPVGLEVGNKIVDLEFEDTEGNVATIRDINEVTFITIGTGWCPPCQAETPGFQDVYEEFQAQGFVVIQALFEDDQGGNPDPTFMNTWKTNYGITFTLVGDMGADFWETLVPPSNSGYIPHNILLDENAEIVYTDYGSMSESKLRGLVSGLYE